MKKPIDNGYAVVGVTTPTQVVPDVEMLTRDDLKQGRWTVHDAGGNQDNTFANSEKRTMFVPTYDDERSRHIQAQQMFHAKCSPTAKVFEKVWAKRQYANVRTLTACEALRVTVMMKQAGFSPDKYVERGSEGLDALTMATHNDFIGVVLGSIQTQGTAGSQAFLNGVGAVQPEWIPLLNKISDEAIRFFAQIEIHNNDKNTPEWKKLPQLNATGSKPNENGFGYTEQLAKWVESIVGALTNEGTEKPKIGEPKKTNKNGKDGGKDGDKGATSEVTKLVRSIGKAGAGNRNFDHWQKGTIPSRGIKESWGVLAISKPPLLRSVMGAIGKKRIACQTGRNPRRMSRLLTDPERRIFDRTVRGAGGVVLIDTSGSMSLDEEQVRAIVLNAPSALVAQYSGGGKPNLYVIANKARMVQHLPRPNGSNEVDYPALVWAIKQRQRPTTPVIWVTDGGVTGKRDAFHADLVMECVRLCKKEGVIVVPDPDDAVRLLKQLQRREKVTSIIPHLFAETYAQVTGQTLVLR